MASEGAAPAPAPAEPPQPQPAVEDQARYASWVRECGGKVRTDLIEVHEFTDGTGRGIRAKAPIKAGEVLVEVPKDALVTAEAAWHKSSKLGSKDLHAVLKSYRNKLSETDIMAVLLMWCRCEGNERFQNAAFLEYLNILPSVEQGPSALHQTMFWTEDELELLRGTDALQIALQLKQQLRQDFGKIVAELFLAHPKLFPVDKFTYREYKWALGILWSRGMDFMSTMRGGHQQVSFRAMVPYADLFNTDFSGPVSHRFVVNRSMVQLLAKQDFAAGEQVFINYTPTSSSRMAQLYGFALRPPVNIAHESMQLWAAMNPNAPNFAMAQQAMAVALPGVDPNSSPFLLTEADPLPQSLIVALHCQRAKPVPLNGVEPSQEVLQELLNALEQRRASYANNGDRMQDLKLAMGSEPLPERKKIALYLRMVEGRILDKALAKLRAACEPAAAAEAAAPAALAELDEMD